MSKMLRRIRSILKVPDLKMPSRFDSKFDPFQVFEVTPEPCKILRVTVVHGRHITKGWAGDLMDTPDPYVKLKVRFTPNSTKRTKAIDNNPNPEWNESFDFYIDSRESNILDVTIMDANYTYDELLGTKAYDLSGLKVDKERKVDLVFNEKTTIQLKLNLTVDTNPDLRYSLALCDEEKQFLAKRRHHVCKALQKLLGDEAGPKGIRETPTIGLLGSGGGFRAMVCLSGIFKALSDEGILDALTFAAGLSGSAWYLSTLYSHNDFPTKTPGELQEELKQCIDQSPFWLLKPHSLYRYMTNILKKKRAGQPVSFTDFFGLMLGDTLLNKRIDSKITNQRTKLQEGKIPFPIYTCLHVKKNVMARVFQEWIEFTPYEVGIAKYGAFMKSEDFGSKFYMGRLVKRFPEFPLHYLQGVWGSAFCILFRQLVREKGQKDLAEMMRDNVGNATEHNLQEQLENFTVDDKDSATSDEEDSDDSRQHGSKPNSSSAKANGSSAKTNGNDHRPDSHDEKNATKLKELQDLNNDTDENGAEKELNDPPERTSMWSSMMMAIMKSSYFNTLSGRAASIFNPLRGLTLQYLYPISPFSPTTPSDDVEFKGTHEALSTENKTLYLVDSGLTFNSPYPLLLRPQRGVDLFLSFDFSARPTDQTLPFKEILLAEKWATKNNIPFPPIKDIVKNKYAKEPIRECYIFQHPRDPYCPVILHFVILNSQFKKFKAPGVPRTTEEDILHGDFPIFDDPLQPYSLFNFSFTHEQFERLSGLMEFNTKMNVDQIKNAIIEVIKHKRQRMPRPPITLGDVARLKMRFRNKDMAKQLTSYVRSFSVKDKNRNRSDELATDSASSSALAETSGDVMEESKHVH